MDCLSDFLFMRRISVPLFYKDSQRRLILVTSDAALLETSDNVCERGQVLLPIPPSSFGYSPVKLASALNRLGISGMIVVSGLDIVSCFMLDTQAIVYLLTIK
jgi:hypothetical protein